MKQSLEGENMGMKQLKDNEIEEGNEALGDNKEGNEEQKRQYWWINSDPKIWDIAKAKPGERQIFTSHNRKGNKRNTYIYLHQARKGDLVLGYSSGGIKAFTALCEVTKQIHMSPEGEGIEIIVKAILQNPVTLVELYDNPLLMDCKTLKNHAGLLFALEKGDYELIEKMIFEKNPGLPEQLKHYKEIDKKEMVHSEPEIDNEKSLYTVKDALKVLFLDEDELDRYISILKHKKNIILQGPPGVGKTFIAKRLAYTIMGEKDENRVKMIQFHQSYSYEDFIQGFRPTEDGKFKLIDGVFYRFCMEAKENDKKPYVFIIDEINRGNLSRIFGELMMLIEKDKRGKKFTMALTYSDKGFFVPKNLHIIGTMNTADRSLAMVDYALRRRFAFIRMNPAFENPKFREHLKQNGVSEGLADRIIDGMKALNQLIEKDDKNLGRGFCIGHSYFCPGDNDNIDNYDQKWFEMVIQNEIRPLLDEYWFDKPEKVKDMIDQLMNGKTE